MNIKFLQLLLCTLWILEKCEAELEIVSQWNLLQFDPPYGYSAVDFRPENTVFTGLEVTADRIFLGAPRLRAGIPATLFTIPRNIPLGSSPKPQPYPDWSYHGAGLGLDNETTCAGLVSVYRMRLDSCGRLWALDSGIMTSVDDFQRICNPKLVVFDLKTNQPVRTVIFPRQVLRPASLLANLIIDETIQGTCDSAFVYLADTAAPGIVVYDALRDRTWRVTHPSMFPDPNFATYTITGESFTLPDGVVGLAHSPKLATVFYQPLATDSIPTATLTKGPPAEFEDIPVTLAGRKSSQGLGLALNPADDTLYFSPLTETSIASWNPLTNKQSIVAFDPNLIQFASELRWIEGSLWFLSTRFQKFFKRTVTPNEINLRVIRVPNTNYNNLNNNFPIKRGRSQQRSNQPVPSKQKHHEEYQTSTKSYHTSHNSQPNRFSFPLHHDTVQSKAKRYAQAYRRTNDHTNCLGLLEDPNRERFQERQSLADDKFGRESLKSSPYIRDVRADSRQSRIDASDIRTDFREIRTELHDGFSRDLVRVDARRESRGTDQVRDLENAQLRTRANQDRENTRQTGRVDKRSFREQTRVRSSENPEADRVAERFTPAQLHSAQRRYSDNPLSRTSASRCNRRMSFEETQPTTSDRRRQFGDRSAETRERRLRSAEDRTTETRSSSRRVSERREDSNRRIRNTSERSTPNFRHLERLSQKSDKNRRDQQRTLQRDNTDILNVRDLERTRRIIHGANVEHRDGTFGERQQRAFRHREESRQNSPDFEKARRLMNQRRVREINLQRARNLESMRFANRNANLQERRFVQVHRRQRLNSIQRDNRVRDLNEESRVKHRRTSLNEQSRESGRTAEGRINSSGRFAGNRIFEPISSPNVEREENRERVVGNIRAQSEKATVYSKARHNQINPPSRERRVVENVATETKPRSSMLVGYNRIVSDSPDANELVDLPARNGKYSNTWVNVAETLLVLALIGQVIGGTSKGKFRCLSWQGLLPKQKVL
ncbi:hypothetical protein HUJ04_007611 [Dendroctonus ponderosae]|nr:hypothetical protein HUJ04_007611 [Dendroctonus ponderosae]